MNDMGESVPLTDEEEEAERLALDRACDEARRENRWVPHEKVRPWLLRIANGEFNAPRPTPDD